MLRSFLVTAAVALVGIATGTHHHHEVKGVAAREFPRIHLPSELAINETYVHWYPSNQTFSVNRKTHLRKESTSLNLSYSETQYNNDQINFVKSVKVEDHNAHTSQNYKPKKGCYEKQITKDHLPLEKIQRFEEFVNNGTLVNIEVAPWDISQKFYHVRSGNETFFITKNGQVRW